MATSEPLLPCPFCGSTDIVSRESGTGWTVGHPPCAATWKFNREPAENAWNRRAGTGWVACADRVPPTDARVLVYAPDQEHDGCHYGDVLDVARWYDDSREWSHGWEHDLSVSHWRPLPAPPPAAEAKTEETP